MFQTGIGESWRGRMRYTTRTTITGVAAAAALLISGCSGDLNRRNGPVTLVVTTNQTIHRVDVAPSAAGCNVQLGTISVQVLQLQNDTTNLPVNNTFNDVQVTGYRVSYQRRDGGTLVPTPITRAASGLIPVGTSGDLGTFTIIDPAALNQAPFAALTPSGGGRDPETGRTTVTMDVIVEVFGTTLAGERVSGSTRFTIDFCYACQGCA